VKIATILNIYQPLNAAKSPHTENSDTNMLASDLSSSGKRTDAPHTVFLRLFTKSGHFNSGWSGWKASLFTNQPGKEL